MDNINRRNFLYGAGVLTAGALNFNNFHCSEIPSTEIRHSSYDPWLEINLSNIDHNIRLIKQHTNGRKVMAVIKGNAYGHGLVDVGKHLEKSDIYGLAVGKLQEALALREAGVKCPVLNFGPFSKDDADHIVGNDISQSVYADNVFALRDSAVRLNRQAKVHIKIDSGMGRVGIPYDIAGPYFDDIAANNEILIEGVFTALTEETEFDKIQIDRLNEICDSAEGKGYSVGLRHAASSAGIMDFPGSYLDMVRPGIAIYGHYPSDREYELKRMQLKPAMTYKTRVCLVKDIESGEGVSYHRPFKAEQKETIVTASTGYSDGIPYRIPDKASALINGRKFPLIAAVTANHISAKVTGAEGIKPGDEIVLFGSQGDETITAEELASAADTSSYKILIWMNPLLPRIYKT
ncbi:MAG: alanine racemase [bacterium]|nr:alanine racemase [bacterium]